MTGKNPYELAKHILEVAAGDKAFVPADRFTSIDLYGAAVHEKSDGTTYNRFHLENESGAGDITLYEVFPGMELVYNEMHMAYCNKSQQPASGVMEINYCKEGRCECLFGEHQYCYMAAGDLSFCSLQDKSHQSEFPTAHYHGITVTIDFSAITDEMRHVLELLSVDIGRIRELSRMHTFLIAHYNEHYTIEDLSERFELSPTVLKKCFKGVYGDSVYAYMKLYRLQVAERLLAESSLTVGEIAARIGYLNPNKFTSAFCAAYGVSPSAYRRKHPNEEN